MGNVPNTTDMQRNVLDKHRGLLYLPLSNEAIHSPKYKLARLTYTRVLHVCCRVSDYQHTNMCI